MRGDEYIEQQIRAGYEVHFHGGVWWQNSALFYCKPVVPLLQIDPLTSAPKLHKSLLGYSHAVREGEMANKFWPLMVMNRDRLKAFSLKDVQSTKRSQIRKGLRQAVVKRIDNLEMVIEDVKHICISTAIRTRHGKSSTYYQKNFKEWSAWILKEFSLPKREWWGAYVGNSLIAYLYGVLIDNTMFINAAKSHTDYLEKCPNDALIFSFLEYCRDLDDCERIIFGDWDSRLASLNQFKHRFGFEKSEIPMHAKYNRIYLLIKKYFSKTDTR